MLYTVGVKSLTYLQYLMCNSLLLQYYYLGQYFVFIT